MEKHPLPNVSEILGELKRRRVYPVIAAYAIVAWIVLQIGEVTLEPLGFPGWVMSGLIILVIAGFPVVVVLAWLFDITPGGIRRSKTLVATTPVDERPSIAVLPFTDMSPDQDQGYFCEGVADEILNALTRIEQLHVAARSSSFQYTEGGDVREIGRELGVRAVLEGSVRKSDDHLRVTAQLVKVSDGYHLWSKSFDEELKDVFEIQDEIAQSIAQALLETITPQQRSAIRTTSSRNVLAYEYYLRGRHFINRFRKKDLEFARQMFRQAIGEDADFALAWAGYADCHSFLIIYADPRASYGGEAARASARALELDPELAEAHASRGLAYLVAEDFENAEAEFNTALELNPRLYEAHYYYGRTKFHQGDIEMAAELFKNAAAVNAADYQARCLRVQILRGLGRFEEATTEAHRSVDAVEKTLRWNPDDVRALHLGAGSLIVLGELDRAKRWMRRALEIDPDDSILLYNVACNYATIDEIDDALETLEAAVDKGMVSLSWVQNDRDLDNLRGHPRFASLLRRLEGIQSEAQLAG